MPFSINTSWAAAAQLRSSAFAALGPFLPQSLDAEVRTLSWKQALSLKAELGDTDGWAVALRQALCGVHQHLSLTLGNPLKCNQPNFQRRRLRQASEASWLSHTTVRWRN